MTKKESRIEMSNPYSFDPSLSHYRPSSLTPPHIFHLCSSHSHVFFTHLIQPYQSFVFISLSHYPYFLLSSPLPSISLRPLFSAVHSVLPTPNCLSQLHLSPTLFLNSFAPSFPLSLSVSPDNSVQALVRVPPPRTN